jgi:hypothetical protein
MLLLCQSRDRSRAYNLRLEPRISNRSFAPWLTSKEQQRRQPLFATRIPENNHVKLLNPLCQ